jgi:K+-transporting ATPase ATPase C chain
MTAIRMMLVLSLLCGALYPLGITALAQFLFPVASRGSLLIDNGKVVGSKWIGQQVHDPRYFWGRPSATPVFPYNAAFSSGSNWGPKNPARQRAMDSRRQALLAMDPGNPLPIPMDLLTASASGLDPHLSPEAAAYQAPRVARLRGMELADVERLIRRSTTPRQFGVLGEPVVNVLLLNQNLDGR